MIQQKTSTTVNIKLLLLTILTVSAFLTVGLNRVTIDFDVLKSLPDSNPAIADAKYIFSHHPFQDRVVIDLSSAEQNLPLLIEKAKAIESDLNASNLFSQVGFQRTEHLIPRLLNHITDNLPFLFTESQLEEQVKPLLTAEQINRQMSGILHQLAGIEGVGQAQLMANDPLELRNLVLARLSSLNPVEGADFHQGFPVSQDQRHVLIVATPASSGTDTASSRKITDLIEELATRLNQDETNSFTITSAGSYRAALDNETIVRRDTKKAILFATLGITLLLLISFPRPYLGVLSLVPAIVGTITAFFICSLLYPSLSILAIGFGGAIISITVDHSIAYLLFLDRPEKVYVRQAAAEVRSIGLIAVLTTVGAFLILTFSGFSILAQIGQFAALGIACSFIFVHTLFPRLIPVIPPAKKKHTPWLLNLMNRFQSIHTPAIPLAVIGFAVVMAFFATPNFNVDLQQMNTVSQETLAAEETLSQTWGEISSKVHLLLEADHLSQLQQKSDLLTRALEKESIKSQVAQVFTPTSLFPGQDAALRNYQAWQKFWSPQLTNQVEKRVAQTSDDLGFSPQAFQPFLKKLTATSLNQPVLTDEFTELLNIRFDQTLKKWMLFITLTPSSDFHTESFKSDLTTQVSFRLFDPTLFSSELGQVLSSTFLKMLVIIGISVVCLIFIFFLDWKLTLLSLVPIAFSLLCTIGTLNLLNHPLDIPGLMLTIIVVGMGIDYSLFMIRSYQRYGDELHPFHGLIRMAILLAAASTLVGFGVLVTAEHNLLHSAGLVSLLGIGYALISAFTLLPPVLRKMYVAVDQEKLPYQNSKSREKRVLGRYARLEAYPRMFAWFKLTLDPMFSEIDQFLENPSRVIDIGCGFGVPAAWILDKYPTARFYGLEPDGERVRVANMMLGKQGSVQQGLSPGIPEIDAPADTAMMLDMLHYLSPEDLYLAFKTIYSALSPGGRLIIRVTLPLKQQTPWYRKIESTQIRLRGGIHYFRPLAEIEKALHDCGFQDVLNKPSGKDREEIWITATTGSSRQHNNQ